MGAEVELSPVIATKEMPEPAKLVDEAGADRLGRSEAAMLRDRVLVPALCAQGMHRVHIGGLVSSPHIRHPVTVAAMPATLNNISQGRDCEDECDDRGVSP